MFSHCSNFAHLLYEEGRRMGMDIQPPYTDTIYSVRPRYDNHDQVRDVLQQVKREFDDVGQPLQLLVIVLDKKDPKGPYSK